MAKLWKYGVVLEVTKERGIKPRKKEELTMTVQSRTFRTH